ncbi:MAG: tetratricopeptide repeat protein [bacterium]
MNRRIAIGVILAGLAVPICLHGALGIEDQLHLADGLFDRGMYDLAALEYVAVLGAVTNHPREAEVTYRIGESYRQTKSVAKAVEFFYKVEAAFPASSYRFKAALRRAEILDGANKTQDVLAILDSTLAANPPGDIAASALHMKGSTLAKAGRKDEAAAAYEMIIKDHAGTATYSYALLALGGLRAGETTGGVARAIELYRLAAEKPATSRVGAEAWFQIASLFFNDKVYDRSAEAFAKLFELYPGDTRIAEARLPRAWALFHARMPADSLRQVEAAMATMPGDAGSGYDEWLYLKANCLRQLMRPGDAAVTYALLIEKAPASRFAEPAAQERVVSLFKANKYEETIKEAKTLIQVSSAPEELYWLLAESCVAVKDEESAIQYYRLILEKCPESQLAPDSGYRLGHILQKREEFRQAADVFGRVAARYQTNAVAAQALFASAACLGRAGMQEEAVRDWSILLQRYPSSVLAEEARYQKAMGEIFLRRDDQAIVSLRELLEKHGSSRFAVEARYWLGVLLDSSGKSRDSEAELRRALASGPDPEIDRRIRLQLAIVLQKTDKPDESAELLSALVGSPLSGKIPPSLLAWLAEHYLAKRNFERAANAAAALSARDANASWQQTGFCLVGRALIEQGKIADARVALENALRISGEFESRAEAAWRLGEIELGEKDYTGARKHLEEAAKLATDDRVFGIRMRAYSGIGKILKAEGMNEEAVKYFMSVGVLFDDPAVVPECLYEAGTLFKLTGRVDESAKAFKELADRYPESVWAREKAR